MASALEAYAHRARDEFLILDNLPREWRALVHEFGGSVTVQLFRMGMNQREAAAMLAAKRAAAGF